MNFEEFGPRRQIEGGIKTRSQRGAIGSSWWSRRFIDVLESLDLGGRLSRGRSYARSGQVFDLDVAAGSVLAKVQGSAYEPYKVQIDSPVIVPDTWDQITETIGTQAIFSAKLLAGEMPADIEEVFTELGHPLFPVSVGDLAMSCDCPDWSVPCKHLAATLYVLAEAFDDDPFLIFAWRGRSREEFVDALRLQGDAPADPNGAAFTFVDSALSSRLDDFFGMAASLPEVGPPTEAALPDLALRQLDDPAIRVGRKALLDILRPAYEAMTQPSL